MKNRLVNILAGVILIAIVVFLAADVGFSLYNPNRLNDTLPVCTLNIIGGNVKVQAKNSLTWEKAKDGMILEPGSRVRTAPDSYAALNFSQGTSTKLEPNTDLIVAKLEGSQNTRPDTIVLEQQAGKTWNQVSARPDGNYHFQIKTSSADVKVRGTLFVTEVNESGETLIQTTEGGVNVSAQGQEVLVSAGQQTTVEPGAAPSAPTQIPPAKNELVLTINKPAVGLVVDPSGSSTGYLPDGSSLNQISGSRLSSPGDSSQTIRIPEPDTGEYKIVLRGADGIGSFSVEGLTEGKSGFIHAESCNITAVNDLVLKLHVDVIDGLLREASLLNPESPESQPVVVTTALKTTKKETESAASPQGSPDSTKKAPMASKKGETSDQKSAWFLQSGGYKYDQRIVITSIVVLAVIFIIIWRKHQ